MINLFKIHHTIISKKRNLINSATTDLDFEKKLLEEVEEWIQIKSPQEAMDVINVMTNWMISNGIDIEKEQLKNIEKQILRND
jgi:predicted house-cleaning noncanonical NTP pyrophosphatase (MazG superfamily)